MYWHPIFILCEITHSQNYFWSCWKLKASNLKQKLIPTHIIFCTSDVQNPISFPIRFVHYRSPNRLGWSTNNVMYFTFHLPNEFLSLQILNLIEVINIINLEFKFLFLLKVVAHNKCFHKLRIQRFWNDLSPIDICPFFTNLSNTHTPSPNMPQSLHPSGRKHPFSASCRNAQTTQYSL